MSATRAMTPTDMAAVESRRSLGNIASDGAGVFAAIVAALCCAGTPLIVGALAALGLSDLRKDAILWPVMLVSLLFALWGFWRGFRMHRHAGPLALGIAGALALALGVIVVHGPAAMPMIYGGSAALLAATFWNVAVRHACRPAESRA
jgi:mercuric ion transport protein